MSNAKKTLIELIEELPEKEIGEIIDFIGYLSMRREKEMFKNLEKASESSTSFWNNSKDDEVWNNA